MADIGSYENTLQQFAESAKASTSEKFAEILKDPQQVSKHLLEDTSAFLLQEKLKQGLVQVGKSGVFDKFGINADSIAKLGESVKNITVPIKKVANDALESVKSGFKDVIAKKDPTGGLADRFASQAKLKEFEIPLDDGLPTRIDNLQAYDPAGAASRVLQSGGGAAKEDAESTIRGTLQNANAQLAEAQKAVAPAPAKQPDAPKQPDADKEEDEDEDKETTGEKIEGDLKKGEKDVEKDGEEDPEMSIPLAIGLGIASLVGSLLIKPKKTEIAPATQFRNYSVQIGA